LLVYSWRDYTA